MALNTTQLAALPAQCLDGELPVHVRAIDVEDVAPDLFVGTSEQGDPCRRMLVLLRKQGRPLGWASLAVCSDGRVSPLALQRLLGADALAGDDRVIEGSPGLELPPGGAPADASISVVIATCADVQATRHCVTSILSSDTEPREVIVVENRPQHSQVREALRLEFGSDERVRYVQEHSPGLASARNAGLRVARGELVAFTDDDVSVDRSWLTALCDAFACTDVDCVTGLIAPLEFTTPTQLLVERFASYGKGFDARIYSLRAPPPDEPLFPYAAGHFASGANMAFRTRALRELGGFDPALGTGTPSRGCEDLDICIRLLQDERRLMYEPRAIIWHRHPDTPDGLRRRAFDYGAALGALLTKHGVLGHDRRGIASRALRGARYFLSPHSRKNAARDAAFPRALKRLELAGVFYGPIAYLASRLRTR